MTASNDLDLPTLEIVEPETVSELAEAVRESAERREPIYPVGGGTSLGFGLPANRPGRVLRLHRLANIVDYPARDMTITVEAGITMSRLTETLSQQGQQLPLDAADADQATLGGILATNFSGPRRFGHGTARDYLIGVQAVDGRGTTFSGGGRVVKNVAGYDFCKMLIGSLGTLGIMTQVTLKVKPQPAECRYIACKPRDLNHAEQILSALTTSKTYPSVVEWIGGPAWRDIAPVSSASKETDWIIVGFEAAASEVDWMSDQLASEWRSVGVPSCITCPPEQAVRLQQEMVEFPAQPEAALTVQASVVPSGTVHMIEAARQLDPECSILSHAGNGIVIVRFRDFPQAGLSRALSAHLRPVAIAHHGSVVVLANPSRQEMTHQAVWGGVESVSIMRRIKDQFDPHGILNPDRFVYP